MSMRSDPITNKIRTASDKTRNGTKRNGTKRNEMEKIVKSVDSGVVCSLALPTLYPKSRVVGSGLIRYMELCTVTRNLFIQSECVFSS